MKTVKAIAIALIIGLTVPLAAQIVQQENVDLDAMEKIKNEGLNRSQVMETMSYLTDVYGPRLTNSPAIKAAAGWAQKKLTEYKLANVKLESWGPFGRGWANERMTAQVITTPSFPLIAYPKAWTPGTSGGAVIGDAIIAIVDNDADIAKFKGSLKGKYVLTAALRDVPAHFEALGHRYDDKELEELSRPAAPRGARGVQPAGDPTFAARRTKFWVDEGVAALIEPGGHDGGTVTVQSGGGRNLSDPPVAPQVVMAVEHYNRIYRMLQKNVTVRIEMNIQNKFYDEDTSSFNIVGEIPGTDKADEVVLLGAHFDSWHTGDGATDNAAGSAVMMEAMRILKATGLKMRRTVRIGLWTGEEQGLLGSRAYVTQHYADRASMRLRPEHAKFDVYFNLDNGTGAIRGVYLQGNEAVAPIFEKWMEPFHDIGMKTLTIRNTGGTDHQSFDAVGLPGFQFIQDDVEYDSRTHHTNMDLYDRIQAPDMMKNAVIVAAFAYDAANRDQLLPRKPLPTAPGK